ncbi:MAG: inorganic phosphate transporter [Alphaproteobacteria bacterium]|nr:inorganic phosphate transporter [Alphaproteobacteria bacterium]
MELTLLIIVIITALIFEYTNGFQDAANAIATVVSTKTLSPRQAILFAAVLNFFGAFAGVAVAKTIGAGIVDAGSVTQIVILCALIGAIAWNLITWYFGLPVSCSHALIGGLLGASIVHSGFDVVQTQGFMNKVFYPMISSPILGFFIGFMFMLLLHIVAKSMPERINKKFKILQLFSAGTMAFSHGSNDAQKTIGTITLALISYGFLDGSDFHVPFWVIFICALTMALGTAAGGWKIIHMLGNRVIKLKPIHGFAAETSASAIILTASQLGIPVSTTHIISTAIMGVGSTVRFSAVKWGLVGNIVCAWVFTIPMTMLIAGGTYALIRAVFL